MRVPLFLGGVNSFCDVCSVPGACKFAVIYSMARCLCYMRRSCEIAGVFSLMDKQDTMYVRMALVISAREFVSTVICTILLYACSLFAL